MKKFLSKHFFETGIVIVGFMWACVAFYSSIMKNTPEGIKAEQRWMAHDETMKRLKNEEKPGALSSLISDAPASSARACYEVNLPNSYMLPAGECVTIASSRIGIGADTLISSIEGAHFKVYASQPGVSPSCDSTQTADRCMSWIKEHVKPGDQGKFWVHFDVSGKIIVRT